MRKQKESILHFLKRGGQFILALLLVISLVSAFPVYLLLKSGEVFDVDAVVDTQRQSDDLVLVGTGYPTYYDRDPYFKFRSSVADDYDVLVIGSSRVMQFRSYHFPHVSFYNAGRGVAELSHFRKFLEGIPESRQPKLIIIGLDQNFFNQRWMDEISESVYPPEVDDKLYEKQSHLMQIQKNYYRVLLDFFMRKSFTLDDLDDPNRIGLDAKLNGNGYRNDGSRSYATIINGGGIENEDYSDYHFQSTIKSIHESGAPFNHGVNVSGQALGELDDFLLECRKRGIYVVGYFTPLAPTAWNEINSMSDEFAYLFSLDNYIRPMFEKYRYGYFDFTDAASHGLDDCEMIDGFHSTERGTLKILIEMASQDRQLNKTTDVDYLQRRLIRSQNCFDG